MLDLEVNENMEFYDRAFESDLESLLQQAPDDADRDLAAKHAPVIYFDEREPFLPLTVGYMIFRKDGGSPSFPREIRLAEPGVPAASLAIEYAIWWDWDIGHLYELEHAWIFLDAGGNVVRVDASWHGSYHSAVRGGFSLRRDGRVALFAQPGKHALAFRPEEFARIRPYGDMECEERAGAGGVWETPLFKGRLPKHPLSDTLVHGYLEEMRFEPTWRFTKEFRITRDILVPWPLLEKWIPHRVELWIDRLEAETPPDKRRTLRIAHRGASDWATENTMQAFEEAAHEHADMVELDVHLTRDGVPVVIHDFSLKRLTGAEKEVSDVTLQEIRQLKVMGSEPIPTLQDVFEWARANMMGVYVELKGKGTDAAVAELVESNGMERYVIVGSFDEGLVKEFKHRMPEVYTSILFREVDVDPLDMASKAEADFVHPCWENEGPRPDLLLSQEWVERVHTSGLGVIAWHEERPEVIRGLYNLGVDGICSNRPDLLYEVR